MNFSIQLMYNASDDNVLDKNTSILGTYTGTLKAKTSILSPTILLEGSIPTTCNYMYIAEFGRYYFIDDISSVTNNTFEITSHVDVLKTYASQIRGCSGIIARQQNNWNLYIDDGTFKTYQNEINQIKVFPSGFNTYEFVLAVAGG